LREKSLQPTWAISILLPQTKSNRLDNLYMMVNTFVWPWKNDDELLEVRQLFYPDPKLPDDARRERQQLGVNIVSRMSGH
jgi:hypothetical protein